MAKCISASLLVFGGIGLLGFAAYEYLRSSNDPRETLVVSSTEETVKDASPKTSEHVVYQLRNLGSNPIRILGLAHC